MQTVTSSGRMFTLLFWASLQRAIPDYTVRLNSTLMLPITTGTGGMHIGNLATIAAPKPTSVERMRSVRHRDESNCDVQDTQAEPRFADPLSRALHTETQSTYEQIEVR